VVAELEGDWWPIAGGGGEVGKRKYSGRQAGEGVMAKLGRVLCPRWRECDGKVGVGGMTKLVGSVVLVIKKKHALTAKVPYSTHIIKFGGGQVTF
jgi:hypothetical protein